MKRILCILIISVITLSSCTVRYESDTYFALDTFIAVNLPENTDCDIYGYIKSLESTISKTDPSSEITGINNNISYTVSDGVKELLILANGVSEKTDGAFDITCGAISSLWDFKSDSPMLPEASSIDAALKNVGYNGIAVIDNTVKKSSNDIKIDLGGIGKGYIAEKCVEYLHENGVTSGYLNLGGNIAVVGLKENKDGWSVALRDPMDSDGTIGKTVMKSGFLSVSGDYERYFEYDGKKYHHIIDPKTGYPVFNELSSVAVFCENGALADALSTALFVMGYEKSMKLYAEDFYTFEAIFITKTGYIYTTDGIKDNFELTSENYIMK